jgi:peptidoglycan/LPS O-acetylase OafA/YrhL
VQITAWCERRGGLLLLVIPPMLVQFSLRPFFAEEHDWADFAVLLCFFILGYGIFAGERFTHLLRRDGLLLFGVGTAAVLALLALYLAGFPIFDWGENPGAPQFYLAHAVVVIIAFCYSLSMFVFGMRFLDVTNAWLRYAQEAALPFFVVHQPVIIIIAYFVVQWPVAGAVKLVVIVLGSFAASIGLYELVIRRIPLLRAFFGITSRRGDKPM